MRARPPDVTKPTKPGGEVGFGKTDRASDSESKYMGEEAAPQWVRRTSDDLVGLVSTLRGLFPSTPLPAHVQRALGRQWSAT